MPKTAYWMLFGPCADALNGDEPPTFHSQCFRQLGELRCNCPCHEWDEGEGPDDN